MTPPEPPPDRTAHLALPEWDGAQADPPARAWRHGYLWMRLGRHDHAWGWWALVDDPRLATRVHASRASSLRELRLHRRADLEDAAALEASPEPGWERTAALIGRVADAVGEGDPGAADARLADALDAVRDLPHDLPQDPPHDLPHDLPADRQRIRLGWVACEVALLTGGVPAVALPHVDRDGEVATPPVYRAGSDHHLAKGLLFAGVLSRDLRVLEVAADLAPPGLAWAVHLARADLGADGALAAAREAWAKVVVPQELADAVTPPPGL